MLASLYLILSGSSSNVVGMLCLASGLVMKRALCRQNLD